MRYLIVDLDHTLADSAWRDHLIPKDHLKGDWDSYHEPSRQDKPIDEIVSLVRAMQLTKWYPIIFTARPEKWYELTSVWLKYWQVPFKELIMRPRGNLADSNILKEAMFLKRFPDYQNHEILFLDDSLETVEKFKDRNITVLQVHARRKPNARIDKRGSARVIEKSGRDLSL